MARPQIEIDPQQVETMASYGMTIAEMADVFKVSRDVLDRRFQGEYHKGRADLKMKLRRKQIDVALGGNVVMLIWLGKQMLGQKEPKQEVDFTHGVEEIQFTDNE